MTIKELIVKLLDFDQDAEIRTIEHKHGEGLTIKTWKS